MATRSSLYLNWSSVTVTPGTGMAISLANILEVDPGIDATQLPFYGDARAFAVALAQVMERRTMTITGGDVWKLLSIPKGTPCTIVAVLNDLTNGASTGAITFTLANAFRKSIDHDAKNNQYATASVMFEAISTDGTTDPLSVAQAA